MERILKFLAIISLITVYCFESTSAQDISSNTFGKGFKFITKDSTMSMLLRSRIQNRYDAVIEDRESDRFSDEFNLRRARLKLDGFIYSPNLVYKIEYDMVNSQMLDAVVKWKFHNNFTLWFGQAKLPGNIERVISSQNLQFVDRSLLNAKYNIDRDKGIQLHHKFKVGNVLFREIVAASQGEGRVYKGDNFGNDYTGRIEILPFGKFMNKGEYFASDLEREQSPKLMVAGTYGVNDEAVRELGQRGDVLPVSSDIQSIFFDMAFKYNGISVMAEYANKTLLSNTPVVLDEFGDEVGVFYTGEGLNAQMGYLFMRNFEVAYRYTEIRPEDITGNNVIVEHTVGFSRYIVGHNLKVQTDISLREEENQTDNYIFRLQIEMAL